MPFCDRLWIDKLQATMAAETARMLWFTASLKVARRSYGEDRRLDQLSRDPRRTPGLSEADRKVDAFRYKIADMFACHELDSEFLIALAEGTEPAGQNQR